MIIKEKGYENGIDFISKKFNKFENPKLRMIFDIANF